VCQKILFAIPTLFVFVKCVSFILKISDNYNPAARSQRRRTERIRASERLRNTDNLATWRAIEAHASARSNSESQNTADHAPGDRSIAIVWSDSEERRREQSRNTVYHATWRSIEENREPERSRDAAAHRITRNSPITRTQRTNAVHHRNTRLQRRLREQQVQEMADERLLTYRSSSQNRQAESSRQSQRNITARAQLPEDAR